MPAATFEESKLISASPEQVYQLIADYEQGHPSILPQPYFTASRVLEGGYGEGTVAEFDMEVMGVRRTLYMTVTEPDPGHILRETDKINQIVTDFIFEPVNAGCRLTFRTTMQFPDTIAGYIEKLTSPMLTRNIFRKELQLIAAHFDKTVQPA